MSGLLPLSEGRELLLAAVPGCNETEMLGLALCAGRVMHQNVALREDDPPFDRSAMDGFAVRSGDVVAGRSMPVSTVIFAEAGVPAALPQGTAARIMTGGAIPPGADAVVPFEESGEGEGTVSFAVVPPAGRHVRRRGENAPAGTVLVPAGTRLSALDLALAAASGFPCLQVAPSPGVALFTTGPELAAPGEDPAPGQIRDTNGPFLRASLARWGAVIQEDGRLADEEDALLRAFSGALATCRLIVVTGGVSRGDRDLVPDALAAAGFSKLFHGLAVKPGKPCWAGVHADRGVVALALPGNPAAVCALSVWLLRPLLERMEGASLASPVLEMPLRSDLDPDRRRESLVPASLAGSGQWQVHATRGSGDLANWRGASHVIAVPAGSEPVRAGTRLAGMPL